MFYFISFSDLSFICLSIHPSILFLPSFYSFSLLSLLLLLLSFVCLFVFARCFVGHPGHVSQQAVRGGRLFASQSVSQSYGMKNRAKNCSRQGQIHEKNKVEGCPHWRTQSYQQYERRTSDMRPFKSWRLRSGEGLCMHTAHLFVILFSVLVLSEV